MRLRTCLNGLLSLIACLLCLYPVGQVRADSPEEQLAAASALFDARKYSEAASRLEAFATTHAQHSKIGPALLTLGRCYSELADFRKALPAYEKALAAADPAVAEEARLGLAETAVRTESWATALSTLEVLLKEPRTPQQAPVLWYWRGLAAFQSKRYDESEAAYARVAQDFPKHENAAPALYGAALAAVRQARLDPARDRLKLLVEKYADGEDRPRAMLLLAQIEAQQKRLPEARRGFEALLREPSLRDQPAAFQWSAEDGLVDVLLELQDTQAAGKRLEEILGRLEPGDRRRPQALLNLGHCRQREKDYGRALAAYDEVTRLETASPLLLGEALFWAGNAELGLNHPGEAALRFAQVVERIPTHALAARSQLKAAESLAAAKKADAAVAAYRKVLEKYPESAEAAQAKRGLAGLAGSVTDAAAVGDVLKDLPLAERAPAALRLARRHLNDRKPEPARALLAELLALDLPMEAAAEAHYLSGLACELLGQPAEAEKELAAAVAGQPAAAWSIDARVRLAWIYLELKRPADAERSAGAALDARPAEELLRQARMAQVQALVDQEKWEACLRSCQALLSTGLPADTLEKLLYTQAWVTERLDRPDEALALWQALLEKFPKGQRADEVVLRIADARFKAEKHDEARAGYARVLAEFPGSALRLETRFKLGVALYHLEKLPEAAAEWDRVAADPGASDRAPEALYWAAVALEKTGKKADAIIRLEKLVQKFPQSARVPTARVRLAALKAVAGG